MHQVAVHFLSRVWWKKVGQSSWSLGKIKVAKEDERKLSWVASNTNTSNSIRKVKTSSGRTNLVIMVGSAVEYSMTMSMTSNVV